MYAYISVCVRPIGYPAILYIIIGIEGGKGKLTQGATLPGRLKPHSLFADGEGLSCPG